MHLVAGHADHPARLPATPRSINRGDAALPRMTRIMHLETEDLSPVHKRVRITVPGADVDASFNSAYAQIARSARAPGFRRGRIPKSFLVKRYRREATSDVARDLLNQGWRKAMDDLSLVPVTEPDITADSPKPGADFVFTVEVEVVPHVELLPYDQLSVEREMWSVPDAVVEHELEHLAERAAPFEEITDRDTVEDGDQIVFNYAGSIEGDFFPGGSQDDAELVIGSGQFIPGFEEQIVGKTKGEDFDIKVTFPEDYHEHLAGKEATFNCHIKVIKTKVVPAIGPDLAKAVGEEDIDAVRAKMREQIQQHHQNEGDKKARTAMRKALKAQYDFTVPPSLVEATIEDHKRDFINKAVREGENVETASKRFEETLETVRAEAEDEVRYTIAIDAIAEQEQVEVDPMEVNAFIEQLIRSMGQYGPQLRAMYRDPNRRANLKRQLRQDKTLDHLLGQANVTQIEKVVPMHQHDDHDDHGHEGHDHGEDDVSDAE